MSARRILLIEDEPAARDGMARLLTDEGYVVCTVASGRAALERIAEFRPDTVICDYYLADVTGLEVLRRMRALANMPVNFIVVTGGCGGPETESVLRREADHFFPKPLDLARFRQVLDGIAAPRGARPIVNASPSVG